MGALPLFTHVARHDAHRTTAEKHARLVLSSNGDLQWLERFNPYGLGKRRQAVRLQSTLARKAQGILGYRQGQGIRGVVTYEQVPGSEDGPTNNGLIFLKDDL